jgi:hypothetical protein
MQTRRTLLALGGLALVKLSYGQGSPAGMLPYRKLTWKDFPIRDDQGKPGELARTEGRIVWKYRSRWAEEKRGWFVARVSELDLTTYFDTRRSWRKSRLGTDPNLLLTHEQGHLDLTYLQMLRLKQVPLEQFGAGTGETAEVAQADLDDKVKRYFETSIAEHQKVQDRYDAETNHGRILPIQQAWERRLARVIAEFGQPAR